MKYTYVMVIFLLLLSGCSEPNKFEQEISKPDWFDSIDAQKVQNEDEVSALWQSKKRCCVDKHVLLNNNRIFYKSCYEAIANHYDDERLVVKCLWLMDSGADSEQRIQLSRFLVDNFSHHKNSITGCVNCMPADTVARETTSLARYERRLGNRENAIDIIETLLDKRVNEISYWVQVETYELLGKMYLERGITTENVARFQEASERLFRAKDYNEPLQKRYGKFDTIYKLIKDEESM